MSTVVATISSQDIQQEIKSIQLASKKVSATKDSARAFLMKNGYITKKGNLTGRYKK